MATEPSRDVDAWGLVPAIPDPPPFDVELGVTTDGEDWGTPVPPRTTSVTRTGFVTVIIAASGFKARYLLLKRGWHRKRL